MNGLTGYNVNVNNCLTNNDNVIDNVREAKVNRIALRLVEKLSNPEGRLFYCKVGWKLSEAVINDNLEQALKGKSPQKYFTWLCKRSMQ